MKLKLKMKFSLVTKLFIKIESQTIFVYKFNPMNIKRGFLSLSSKKKISRKPKINSKEKLGNLG